MEMYREAFGREFAEWLSKFGEHLGQLGYTDQSREVYLGYCRRLCEQAASQGIGPAGLDETHVESFVEVYLKTAPGSAGPEERARRVRAPAKLLLRYLRSEGVAPAAAAPPGDSLPLCREYREFLLRHRGLNPRTCERHMRYVRRFLSQSHIGKEEDVGRLSIQEVDRFFIAMGQELARRSMGGLCAAVRGFLGYAQLRGILANDLKSQVMTPRLYELETVRKALEWSEVKRILAAVDRTTDRGLRNYAMLLLLAMCGLRSGEVARLRLEDIDWRAESLWVYRSKTDSADRIPLVSAVGDALIAYLRCRPGQASCPEVFVTVRAPYRRLVGSSLVGIVVEAMERAGVQALHRGPHTLRHSYAVHLLRQGMSLKAIGDAMGHRHPRSTYAYAKASTDDLREVALELTEVLP